MISVIVLTCDSQLSKNFCLRHCLQSIVNQNCSDLEIVIVDNGRGKARDAENLVACYNKSPGQISMKYVDLGGTIPRGRARNIGAENASEELLVFMDEDVILVDRGTMKIIEDLAKDSVWGCGASRLWTKGNWFNVNAEQVLDDISLGQYEPLLENAGLPERFIRGSEDVRIETRSMISHFGYCRKSAFNSVGGFEDAGDADSYDDDILNLKLFQQFGYPHLFPEIQVIHINHPISGSRAFDFTFYFEYLVKKGLFDFDSENLIFGDSDHHIQTTLSSIHYNTTVSESYQKYQLELPLNHKEMNEEQLDFWRRQMRLGPDDYCRVVWALLHSPTVEEYIKSHATDYDNLAPILSSLLSNGLLSLRETGEIHRLLNFDHRRRMSSSKMPVPLFNPRADLNQFPCDKESVLRRVDLLRCRYPYCEFLRLGIVGDDDFLAAYLRDEVWIQPVVIEKDPVIKEFYGRTNINCIGVDLLELSSDGFTSTMNNTARIHTFITDPPYTLHGALSFLFTGLYLMEFDGHEKEFYMVMNPSIIGRSLNELIRLLSMAGIVVKETIHAFSSYPFPKNYDEIERAEHYNKKTGFTGSQYSSTSNLYIFGTSNPDLGLLKDNISSRLFYKHYQL